MFLDFVVVKRIVGSVVQRGLPRPFVIDCDTRTVELDRFLTPQEIDLNQFDLSPAEREQWVLAIARQAGPDVESVRIGEYYCDVCKRWQDALHEPWSVAMCLNCSIDRDSERFGS